MLSFSPQRIWPMMLALAAFAFVMTGAAQASSIEAPDSFMQSFGDKAIEVLDDGTLDSSQRRSAFSILLEEGFDMDRIAKLALGRYWRTATTDQKQAYIKAFQKFVIESYDRRLQAYSGQKLIVKDWRPVKKDALVHSEIVGSGSPVAIDWRLSATDQGWQVVDVVVEGVSMLVTQRNEFASIIERLGGLEALVKHLEGSIETASASG